MKSKGMHWQRYEREEEEEEESVRLVRTVSVSDILTSLLGQKNSICIDDNDNDKKDKKLPEILIKMDIERA